MVHGFKPPLYLTPGPSQFIPESVKNLSTSFGRGDTKYSRLEREVEGFLLDISGQSQIISLQGSGSLANQIIAENFLYGDVLVLDTGFYSSRLRQMAEVSTEVTSVHFVEESKVPSRHFDWLFATPVETGVAKLLPIARLREIANGRGAQLALDAVASIGLEEHHEEADVLGFSSCKGLFGLTGACFVASKKDPENKSIGFFQDYQTHKSKKVTGPYNQIQSIHGLKDNHSELAGQVAENKNVVLSLFREYLVHEILCQPKISTLVRTKYTSPIDLIDYLPREKTDGCSTISSLGFLEYWVNSGNPYESLRPQNGKNQ